MEPGTQVLKVLSPELASSETPNICLGLRAEDFCRFTPGGEIALPREEGLRLFGPGSRGSGLSVDEVAGLQSGHDKN